MKKIPAAVGPYSAFRIVDKYIYVSGQLGINPETNEIDGKDAAAQALQSLTNLKNTLENNGYTMNDVIKTTVLLDNIGDFVAVNEVYATFFTEPYPARSAFEVGKLPKGGLVEIEAIAYKG